jgi:hypothetical protein
VKISKSENDSNSKKRARGNDMKSKKKEHDDSSDDDDEKKNNRTQRLKEYDDSDLDIIEILEDDEDIQIVYDRKKYMSFD